MGLERGANQPEKKEKKARKLLPDTMLELPTSGSSNPPRLSASMTMSTCRALSDSMQLCFFLSSGQDTEPTGHPGNKEGRGGEGRGLHPRNKEGENVDAC